MRSEVVIDVLIGSLIGLVASIIIIKFFNWLCDTPYLSPEERRRIDDEVEKMKRRRGG